MTSDRPYRPALASDEASEELRRGAGSSTRTWWRRCCAPYEPRTGEAGSHHSCHKVVTKSSTAVGFRAPSGPWAPVGLGSGSSGTPLATHALKTPDDPMALRALRQLDLLLLGLALVVFLLAGLPLLGWAAAAAAWVAQRAIAQAVVRRAGASDDPRTVAGLVTASMIGRAARGGHDLRRRHGRARGRAVGRGAGDPAVHGLVLDTDGDAAIRAGEGRPPVTCKQKILLGVGLYLLVTTSRSTRPLAATERTTSSSPSRSSSSTRGSSSRSARSTSRSTRRCSTCCSAPADQPGDGVASPAACSRSRIACRPPSRSRTT